MQSKGPIRNLAEMMFSPGNRDTWAAFIRDRFVPCEPSDSIEDIIEYLSRERDLIHPESCWSEEEKLKRLMICIKVKLMDKAFAM